MVSMALRAMQQAGEYVAHNMRQQEPARKPLADQARFLQRMQQEVERTLVELLQKHYKHHQFENADSILVEGDVVQRWCILPISGARNLVSERAHFCLGLAFYMKDQLEHVVLYNPVTDESAWASKGYGGQLSERRIRVTEQKVLDDCQIVTNLLGSPVEGAADALATLTEHTQKLFQFQAPLLDAVYTCAGRYDLAVLTGLDGLDLAITQFFAKEAGGLTGDTKGAPAQPGKPMIIANPKLFKATVQALHRVL